MLGKVHRREKKVWRQRSHTRTVWPPKVKLILEQIGTETTQPWKADCSSTRFKNWHSSPLPPRVNPSAESICMCPLKTWAKAPLAAAEVQQPCGTPSKGTSWDREARSRESVAPASHHASCTHTPPKGSAGTWLNQTGAMQPWTCKTLCS